MNDTLAAFVVYLPVICGHLAAILARFLAHFSEFLPKIIAECLVAGGGALFFTMGERIARHWHQMRIWIRTYVSRRKYILLWVDTDITTVRGLARRLKNNFPYVRIRALDAPQELLLYPMRSEIIEAVILISTDVTRLSSDDKIKEKIEKRLEKYIHDGGGLVAGHDMLYRRTRNKRLSTTFGVSENKFIPLPSVTYDKTDEGKNHPIGQRLNDRFTLEDGEVLKFDWDPAAKILFVYQDDKGEKSGLVVAQEKGQGRLVWLNSCDCGKDGLGKSIAEPNGEFVDLLAASVEWVAKVKQLAKGAPLIAAHRGVTSRAGENTIPAFQAAIDQHVDFIECDIRRTKDGVLVLHHDADVGKAKTIAENSFNELTTATGSEQQLAKLEDLLDLAKGRIGLDLELKEAGYELEIANMVRSKNLMTRDFVVTSFLDKAISTFKECYPEAKCGLLLGEGSWLRDRYPERRLRRLGVDFVAAKDSLVNLGFAQRLAGKGFPVWVWTVNDSFRIKKLLRTTGVEAIITDRVSEAKKARTESQER